MRDFITIEGKAFAYNEIRSGVYTQQTTSDYTRQTLDFCQAWLNQQTHFSIHTSGSTGTPKLIQLSRAQLQKSAKMTGKAIKLKPNHRALVCLNTQYIAGIMMLVRGFELGLQMDVIPPSENPLKSLSNIQTFDFVALVPMQVQAILGCSGGTAWLNALHALIIGGAPVNYVLAKQLKTLTSNVYITYGMTETVSHIALRHINAHHRADEYQVLPEVSIRQDARGCIEINSPTTLNEWITTNDLIELIDASHFRWLGRADRVINSGGVKVQVETVEQALDKVMSEQGIHSRFFVAGLPDARLGQQVIVVIEGTTLATHVQDDILQQLAQLLKKYEVPKKMYFVPIFAQTPTAKIDQLHILKHLS